MEEIVERMDRYRIRAHRKLRSHYLAATQAERKHTLFGVPVVVCSTVVGTTIFASLSRQPQLSLIIGTGLLSIAAAVLAALQTFFKFAELAEKHRTAAAKYAALYRSLDLFRLKTSAEKSQDWSAIVRDLEPYVARWDQLEAESPNVPDALYDQAVREEQLDSEKA